MKHLLTPFCPLSSVQNNSKRKKSKQTESLPRDKEKKGFYSLITLPVFVFRAPPSK
jgi:hypothetical protein